MTTAWKAQLKIQLKKKYGEKQGSALAIKYLDSFPTNYQDNYSTTQALQDISSIEKISAKHPLEVDFYYSAHEGVLRLRLFQWETPIPLSDILPMLENLDLRIFSESPHQIKLAKNANVCISDFNVAYTKGTLVDIKKVKELLQETLERVYSKQAENDGFNKLVLGAALSWNDIIILRAYAKYLRQVGFRLTQPYIEKALVNNPAITQALVKLFNTLNDPKQKTNRQANAEKIEKQIIKNLEDVQSLDEDRIVRRYLDLIKATLRTNYYQLDANKQPKPYLSFKLNSKAIPDLPLPTPLYEIFVYSPRFEGIHLRNTKVARGGIRWSDRREDFRTEILGLMKAQTVKNAVIVPSGAKGGFVLKANLDTATREEKQKEVVACYKSFISGLLDLTDNIKDTTTIRPPQTVCYDEPDPYLVVAADKGTATFSDTANAISKEYNFWLGDAFASGGATGYDHKKMGITARGAWESVKRHFRELDLDLEKNVITVVGIGDMSGDVFGNGAIYSKNIKLLAAFDHRDIFIDPNPDPSISYQERLRLFQLPTSSWQDYNAKLISKGGGVYSRSLKSIPISPEAKKALGIQENALTPNELIQAILKAPVQLLWNGGIGTYVKSFSENNADVGDRTNDFCRVNGMDLRCKVVGEGGNLGFTQLGRVEFALNGGLINTDFIDNSAGVDCSDHEVNLKILLDKIVNAGKLSESKRNKTLADVTKEVAALVLHDNYQQALIMSNSAFRTKENLGIHQAYIKELESLGELNRSVEFLPDDKKLLERKAAGFGLTRPELAILLAYTKIHVKHEILKSALPEDPFFSTLVETAFPPSLRKEYHIAMQDHRLRRDIIATQLSNLVVNEMGITFVYRLEVETGASVADIIRAQTISSQIFNIPMLQKSIEKLDFKIPMHTQYELLYQIRHLVNLATRWFLHNDRLKGNIVTVINHYKPSIELLTEWVPTLMVGFTKSFLEKLTQQFVEAGLSKDMARHFATYRAMYTSLNIIEVATNHKFDLVKTAQVYFAVGDRFSLVWFRDQIAADTREGHWNTLARLTLRDELDFLQRALTVGIMLNDKKEPNIPRLIEKWVAANSQVMERWEKILGLLHGSATVEYTMFFVSLHDLMALIHAGVRKAFGVK